MKEDILLHSVGHDKFYIKNHQMMVLEEILKSKKVLSMNNQNKESNRGFAGSDYISLCDYSKREIVNEKQFYNSFYGYIVSSISLIFPKEEIDFIVPEIINRINSIPNGYNLMEVLGCDDEKRYSDLPDEVQVKDEIDLSHLTTISFPCETFILHTTAITRKRKIEKLKSEIEDIQKLLEYYNYNVPIVDISTMELISDEYIEKLILK